MQGESVFDLSQKNYNEDNYQHIFAIDGLVHELGMPAEEVNRVYREILEDLKEDVSERAFLPNLVSIGVKIRLTRSSAKPA